MCAEQWSQDMQEQPELMMRGLCDATGIQFTDKMLSWPAGAHALPAAHELPTELPIELYFQAPNRRLTVFGPITGMRPVTNPQGNSHAPCVLPSPN